MTRVHQVVLSDESYIFVARCIGFALAACEKDSKLAAEYLVWLSAQYNEPVGASRILGELHTQITTERLET